MKLRTAERLTEWIAAECPIHGVSIASDKWNPADVKIDYKDEATKEERELAVQLLGKFDPSDEAQAAWEEAQQSAEKREIKASVAKTVGDNEAYLANEKPTIEDMAAQVRLLTEQAILNAKRLAQVD